MSNPFREIRVFISSLCDGDYTPVRRELYDYLNDSPVFEPSMFEEYGATTCQPREAYLRELTDCDVCVFIIRKADGISGGVFSEIDCAIKNKKKSLFFFVGYSQDEYPEELRDRIPRSSMPVYQKDLERLEDVPRAAFAALQRDVMNVYRGYCNDKYVYDSPDAGESPSTALSPSRNLGLPKSTIRGIGATIEVFNEFILGESEKDREPQGDIDKACYDLARRFLFDGSVEAFDWGSLIRACAESIGEQYPSDVVELRWKSIVAYYRQDFAGALDYQKQAYEVAKRTDVPDWFLDDILIDLRNTDSIETFLSATYQELLNEREIILSYPALDRENSDFYSDLAKEQRKEREKSIYTVTYGHTLNSPIEHLAKIFLIAAAYGSLTHLLIMRERLEAFAIHLCDQYGNNAFGMLLLRLLLCSGDGRSIQRLTQSMDGIDEPSSSECAYEAYEMVRKCASPLSREAAQFEAFRMLGAYMTDSEYRMASASFMAAVQSFDIVAMRDVRTGVSLVDAIQANAQELDPRWIIAQLIRLLKYGVLEVSEAVFRAIQYGAIDSVRTRKDNIAQLVNSIGEATKRHPDHLGNKAAIALLAICRQRPEMTESCTACAEENLNEHGRNLLLTELNIEDEKAVIPAIERYIKRIEDDNEAQGVNGIWSHSMMAEYENVGNLIQCLEEAPKELTKRAASAALGTIDNERRMLKEKREAYVLLLRLLALSNVEGIEDLGLTSRDLTDVSIDNQSSPMMSENESLLDLSICHEAILVAIGANSAARLEDLLIETYGAREFDQAVAAETLMYLLHAIGPEKVGIGFASFLHAYAGALFRSDSFQVRIQVIELLFEMLRIPSLAADVSRQLVASYDSKSPNEKCRIIRHQNEIREANEGTWIELKRKALQDHCSISRDAAEKLFGAADE